MNVKPYYRAFSSHSTTPPLNPDSSSDKEALGDKSTWELLNHYMVYQLCRFPFVIKNSSKITNLAYRILGKRIVNFMIEKTIGKVFTAGSSVEDLTKEMDALSQKNIYSVADLSIEDVGDASKEYLEANKEQSADTLRAISENPRNTMAMKVTALTYLNVLKDFNVSQKKLYDLFVELAGYKLDAFITKDQVRDYLSTKFSLQVSNDELEEFFRFVKQGSTDTNPDHITAIEHYMNIHAYPIDPMLKNSLISKIAPLEPNIVNELDDWMKRINSVLEDAKRVNAYVMIDAEQTFIQYGIDSITRQMQRLLNKDKVLVMNTYQASLKRTKRNVCLDLLGCEMRKQPFAAKLVRGAYVTEENKIALDHEVESPVFPNKALVDKSYNITMSFVLNKLPPNSHFNIASHNDTTVQIAEEIMAQRRQEFEDKKIQISFAQLKGLSDKLTVGLAQRGHYTFKYVPYGPTKHLVPYLFRRAEEASYIWVEGQKKLDGIRHELFNVRKVHYKASAAVGLLFLGVMLI